MSPILIDRAQRIVLAPPMWITELASGFLMEGSEVGMPHCQPKPFVYRKILMEQPETVGRRCPLIIAGDTLFFRSGFG